MKRLLDVGGGSPDIPIPDIYEGYQRIIMDVREGPGIDIVMDAREILLIDRETFEAYDVVYCSHTLEHFEPWDTALVIEGLAKAVKTEGWLEIRVPDVGELAKRLIEAKGDVNHVVYTSAHGVGVTIGHLLWGYGPEIQGIGEAFRHRNGFSRHTLTELLRPHFSYLVFTHEPSNCELRVVAYKQKPERHVYDLTTAQPAR